MVKKEKELNPIAIKNDKFNIDFNKLKIMSENINKLEFEKESTSNNDTFYKLAIEKLFDENNIETKTEFLSPAEVFTASKLSFLGTYGCVPLLNEFVESIERKRISLNRKGREEIVLSLQERHQEDVEMRKAQLGFFTSNQR
jgi:hypothetical protein